MFTTFKRLVNVICFIKAILPYPELFQSIKKLKNNYILMQS